MFCVLPIMVLIYGGCSSIYCIYKCRQYLRRRKHKRLREEEEEEDSTNTGKTDLNTEVNGKFSSATNTGHITSYK